MLLPRCQSRVISLPRPHQSLMLDLAVAMSETTHPSHSNLHMLYHPAHTMLQREQTNIKASAGAKPCNLPGTSPSLRTKIPIVQKRRQARHGSPVMLAQRQFLSEHRELPRPPASKSSVYSTPPAPELGGRHPHLRAWKTQCRLPSQLLIRILVQKTTSEEFNRLPNFIQIISGLFSHARARHNINNHAQNRDNRNTEQLELSGS